jgi:hypothetical protein
MALTPGRTPWDDDPEWLRLRERYLDPDVPLSPVLAAGYHLFEGRIEGYRKAKLEDEDLRVALEKAAIVLGRNQCHDTLDMVQAALTRARGGG